jgi:aminoglycoside 3-N-acetyltransferase
MKILLIGVGWNRCSALHAAESAAEYKRTVVRKFKLGTESDAPWIEAPDVADDLGTLFPLVGAEWEKTGNVQIGKIGDAEYRLTDYDLLVSFASKWISARNEANGLTLPNA